LLDRSQADGAVSASSRQHNANRTRSVFGRQRMQQEVERQTCPAGHIGLRQAQGAILDGQIAARRNDIEVFRQDGHAVLRLQHRQGRVLGQQFHEQAGVSGIEVLDQHEGHCCRRGQRIEQLLGRLKAAGRCADRDDPHLGDRSGSCSRHHWLRTGGTAGRI
jgi:hypothetical protein